jgi:hypothetical protein
MPARVPVPRCGGPERREARRAGGSPQEGATVELACNLRLYRTARLGLVFHGCLAGRAAESGDRRSVSGGSLSLFQRGSSAPSNVD